MIQLIKFSRNDVIPDSDYVLDKTDKLFDLISFLTPKFEDKWVITLVDPRIKFVKELIRSKKVPDWIIVQSLLSQKKINEIVIDFPQYEPKELSLRNIVNEIVSKMKHVIDEPAKKLVIKAVGKNPKELSDVFAQLDRECTTPTITLKQAQSVVVYQKRIYASEVIREFLLRKATRWSKLTDLIHELGEEFAYYALRSYVRKLLVDKNSYLNNEEYSNRLVEEVDAPLICYVYSVFSLSTNYKQLMGVMTVIDNRSRSMLERMQNVNL